MNIRSFLSGIVIGLLAAGHWGGHPQSHTPDGKLTDWAIDQLQRKRDKPFFIALGLRKPHIRSNHLHA